MNSLKFYRKEENISLSELSISTGISQRYLRFIESGERSPSLLTAKKIADCLNKSIDEVFFKSLGSTENEQYESKMESTRFTENGN